MERRSEVAGSVPLLGHFVLARLLVIGASLGHFVLARLLVIGASLGHLVLARLLVILEALLDDDEERMCGGIIISSSSTIPGEHFLRLRRVKIPRTSYNAVAKVTVPGYSIPWTMSTNISVYR